ncbi:hypothetical protein GCM10020000_13200 [Streptomyces olivoverticillatus]
MHELEGPRVAAQMHGGPQPVVPGRHHVQRGLQGFGGEGVLIGNPERIHVLVEVSAVRACGQHLDEHAGLDLRQGG